MAILDLNTIKQALQMAGKIEFYPQILETQEKLLEMQKKIADLESENKRLREELGIKGTLVPEGNLYWIEKDSKRDGPFCTCCWDSERKLMRLHTRPVSGRVECPNCKTEARGGTTHVFKPTVLRRNPGM